MPFGFGPIRQLATIIQENTLNVQECDQLLEQALGLVRSERMQKARKRMRAAAPKAKRSKAERTKAEAEQVAKPARAAKPKPDLKRRPARKKTGPGPQLPLTSDLAQSV